VGIDERGTHYTGEAGEGRVMEEAKNKSEFYHFGILPRVCIHTPGEDQYSKMYKPREVCECGCKEWIDGTMALANIGGVECMFKDVHRCKECGKVRMSDHIGREE
jgi:hypothetical protein